MFYPQELDGGMLGETETEAVSLEDCEPGQEIQAKDLEDSGLDLSDAEAQAIAEAGEMPLEDTMVEKAYATTRCEGCVGSHTGTGVHVTIHNL